MVRIRFPPLGPQQEVLDEDKVREILNWRPRRFRLGGRDWPNVLHAPRKPDNDWLLSLPFRETFANAFLFGCEAPNIGIRKGSGVRCYTFLSGTAGLERADLKEVLGWLDVVGRYVAIRDGLCLSFALDFEREDGDPTQSQTEIGALRTKAKPYGRPPTPSTIGAADELANHLIRFLGDMVSYKGVDSVVAMPASRSKPFHLPAYLSDKVAEARGFDDLSTAVTTLGSRPEMKDVPIGEKVDTLMGTIEVDEDAVAGRNLLILDDLYQSGASVNVAALHLLDAGAERVYGLYCEKTCRNDDNTGG